jgi:hypothetical protein
LKAYQGDVKALTAAGFDGLKLDNCGQYTNLSLYADLINKTGHPVLVGNKPTLYSLCTVLTILCTALVENCHWGLTVPTETVPTDSQGGNDWAVTTNTSNKRRNKRQNKRHGSQETRRAIGVGGGRAQVPSNGEYDKAQLPHWTEAGALHCPYNLYRTSADVYPDFGSVMHNLFSTTPFQNYDKPLSQPGCWAYPGR